MKQTTIQLVQGDITRIKTDAIVNSANETLLGDDGVDGAIHLAAGSALRAYCAKLGGCKVAEVKVTPGFNLPHKHILHTVGPQYDNENGQEAELLAACYLNSLMTADALRVKSVAFPSISTGQYGYPIHEAAQIALTTIHDYLQTSQTNLDTVIIVTYPSSEFNDTDIDDYRVYQDVITKLQLPVEVV